MSYHILAAHLGLGEAPRGRGWAALLSLALPSCPPVALFSPQAWHSTRPRCRQQAAASSAPSPRLEGGRNQQASPRPVALSALGTGHPGGWVWEEVEIPPDQPLLGETLG